MTVHFKTNAAATVWEHEITGQISDGTWENARPINHWKFWCDAEVKVDGKLGYEGWPEKTNYSLGKLMAYKEVKERIVDLIRFSKSKYGIPELQKFAHYLTSEMYCVEHPDWFPAFNERSIKEEIASSQKYIEEFKDSIKQSAITSLKKVPFIKIECLDMDALFKLLVESTFKSVEKYVEMTNAGLKQDQEILRSYGITKDNLSVVFHEIMQIPVSPKEVSNCMDEIKGMFSCKLA